MLHEQRQLQQGCSHRRWSCRRPRALVAVLVACLLTTVARGCSDPAQHSSQQLDTRSTSRRSLQSTGDVKAQLRATAVARHTVHATPEGRTARLRKRLQSARDSVAAALAALQAALARKRNAAAALVAHAGPPPPPPPSNQPAQVPATAQKETGAPAAPAGTNTTIHKRACGQPEVSPAEATAVQNRLAPGIVARQTVRACWRTCEPQGRLLLMLVCAAV